MKLLSAAICLLAAALAVESRSQSLRTQYRTKTPLPLQPYSKHLHKDVEGTRVYGGEDAGDISVAPFQAALFVNGQFFCSGGIISKDWIITAAHCVDAAAGDIVVQVGTVFLDPTQAYAAESQALEESPQTMTTTTADRTMHPNFDIDYLDNDIALIKLPQSLNLRTGAKALQLPTYADATLSMVGQRVQVAGWGRINDENGPSVWPRLQVAELNIAEAQVCEDVYGNAMIGTKLCAGTVNPEVSTCTGDSGGPIVEYRLGKFILYAITSFGSNRGCTVGRPVVFTKVSAFLEYIETTTGLPISD